MRRIVVLLFSALLGLHGVSAFAEQAATTAKAKQPASSDVPARGTLYRIDYRGNTCYLFGTVHIGQAAFYPLEPRVTRALRNASQLVIEVDIRNTDLFRQAVVRHGLYADGTTIDQHLSPANLAQLKSALQRNGIVYDNVARMKPWMLANVLIIQEMARNGFPTEQGIEQYFLQIATQQGKKVGELETADYQLSLYDKLDDAQQQDYLSETMSDIEDGTILRKGLELIDAWQKADHRKMEALKLDMMNDKSTSSRFIEDILLNQRNPGMTDKIETLFKNDKSTFVAVGALHLIGDNSVPALLKQRGYQVTRLY